MRGALPRAYFGDNSNNRSFVHNVCVFSRASWQGRVTHYPVHELSPHASVDIPATVARAQGAPLIYPYYRSCPLKINKGSITLSLEQTWQRHERSLRNAQAKSWQRPSSRQPQPHKTRQTGRIIVKPRARNLQ